MFHSSTNAKSVVPNYTRLFVDWYLGVIYTLVPLILLKTDGVSLEMLDLKFLARLIVYSQNRKIFSWFIWEVETISKT